MFFRKKSGLLGTERERKRRFEQGILCHLDAAYNLARWLTRHDQDAQDVVQEAILRAYTFFDTYQGGDSRAWFLTIVRRTCYTFLRRNRAHEFTHLLEDENQEPTAEDNNPERLLLKRVEERLLTEALERLPLPYREVIVLREIEGMSYKEIAELTEVPTGTVMSRIARARKRLQEDLLQRQAAIEKEYKRELRRD
jgi:RNA polymerase sigma-70 factor (ECF subfamily)